MEKHAWISIFWSQLKSSFLERLGDQSIFGVLDQFYDYRPVSLLHPSLTPPRFGKKRDFSYIFGKVFSFHCNASRALKDKSSKRKEKKLFGADMQIQKNGFLHKM